VVRRKNITKNCINSGKCVYMPWRKLDHSEVPNCIPLKKLLMILSKF